jgi:hypothetical protein
MGGPPDTGGAKSPIQARASTVSYLQRYTLKAICGVSEQGDDTDSRPEKRMDEGAKADFLAAIEELTTPEQAADLIIQKLRDRGLVRDGWQGPEI